MPHPTKTLLAVSMNLTDCESRILRTISASTAPFRSFVSLSSAIRRLCSGRVRAHRPRHFVIDTEKEYPPPKVHCGRTRPPVLRPSARICAFAAVLTSASFDQRQPNRTFAQSSSQDSTSSQPGPEDIGKKPASFALSHASCWQGEALILVAMASLSADSRLRRQESLAVAKGEQVYINDCRRLRRMPILSKSWALSPRQSQKVLRTSEFLAERQCQPRLDSARYGDPTYKCFRRLTALGLRQCGAFLVRCTTKHHGLFLELPLDHLWKPSDTPSSGSERDLWCAVVFEMQIGGEDLMMPLQHTHRTCLLVL